MTTTPTKQVIEEANALIEQDKLLEAARLLRTIKDDNDNTDSVLTDQHRKILTQAIELESIVQEFRSEPGEEWSRHYEHHHGFDVMVYFKADHGRLTSRCESPIEPDLLVPLLSVFNETSLFCTWLPRWEMPLRMGVRSTAKLQQDGRVNQRMKAITDVPWPMKAREAIIDVVAVDEIDRNGVIVVRMTTPESTVANDNDNDGSDGDTNNDDGDTNNDDGDTNNDDGVPEVEEGCVRIDFHGGLVFQKCPKDHPALVRANKKKQKNKKKTKKADDDGNHTNDDDDEEEEASETDSDMILCGVSTFVDAKVAFVPVALINFVTKTVIGRMWAQTLAVARDVRDGKRPDHSTAIQESKEVYDWVASRAEVLLGQLGETDGNGNAGENANVNTEANVDVDAKQDDE